MATTPKDSPLGLPYTSEPTAPTPPQTNDIFAQHKSPAAPDIGNNIIQNAIRDKVRQLINGPTKAQQKAQQEQQKANLVAQAQKNITGMVNTDQWLNASPDMKQDLQDSWVKNVWTPYTDQFKDSDPDLQEKLNQLPKNIMGTDIKNANASVAASSRTHDIIEGAKASGEHLANAGTLASEGLSNALSSPGIGNAGISTGNPEEDLAVQQYAASHNIDTSKLQQQGKAAVEEEADKTINARNAKATKDLSTPTYAEQMYERRKQELQKKDNSGLWSTLDFYKEHPSQIGVDVLKNAPALAATTAATIAGGVTGGPAGAVAAGAASNALLTGGSTAETAFNEVKAIPQADIEKLPKYQQEIKSGKTPEQARDALALSAANEGMKLGGAIGAATGAIGPETMAGSIVAKALGGGLLSTTTKGILGRVTAGVAKGLAATAANAAQGGASKAAENVAYNSATGSNRPVSQGVGQAVAEGVATGLPFTAFPVAESVVSGGRAPVTPSSEETPPTATTSSSTPSSTPTTTPTTSTTANTRSTGPVIATGEPEGDNTLPETASGFSSNLPSAQEIADESARGGNGTETSPTPTRGDQETQALLTLNTTLRDMRSRNGQTYTPEEANRFVDALMQAEDNGVSPKRINTAAESVTRAVPEGMGYTSIIDALRQRRDALASAVNALARKTVNNVENLNEDQFRVEGNTDTGAPASNTGNSTTEANTTNSNGATLSALPESTEQTFIESPVTGTGGAGVNGAATSAGNPEANGAMGDNFVAGERNSGSGNRLLSNTSQEAGTGERSVGGTTGERANNGRSTTAAVSGATGTDVNVGDTVTYQGNYTGARPITGRIQSLNADGTFNMDVPQSDGTISTVGNLNTNNIIPIPEQNNAIQEQGANAQMLGQQQPQLGLRSVGEGNAEPQETTGQSESENEENQSQETPKVAPPVANTAEQLGRTAPFTGSDADIINNSVTETTASGYTPEDLSNKADIITSNPAQASDASSVSLVSDFVQQGEPDVADEVAQAIYDRGLRTFATPQESTGRAARTVNDSFLNDLSSAERMGLQNEYDRLAPDLPPEASTFPSFRDTAVHDQILEDAGQPTLTNILTRLSEGARNIIRKMARGLAIVLAAITINHMTPADDAIAAVGHSSISIVRPVDGLSHEASVVKSWVQAQRDTQGKPYIIADKRAGEIHIVDGKGKVVASSPALFGKELGDKEQPGETPAGVFILHHESAPKAYGNDLQAFATTPSGDVYAIHRVLTTNKSQHRLQRLSSKNPALHRISLGCINIPANVYNKYLKGNFGGKLYVIPDQRSLGDVFQGIQETQARQDLKTGGILGQDLNNPVSDQFKTSTSELAKAEVTPAGRLSLKTGAFVIQAAGDPLYSTSLTMAAAPSNDSSDHEMFYASLTGFIRAGANQRKSRKGRNGNSPDEENPADEPDNMDDLSNKDWATMQGSDNAMDKPPVAASNALQNAVTTVKGLTESFLSKIIDSDHYFIRWMIDKKLVPTTGEYDDAPLIRFWKSALNRGANRTEYLLKKYFMPMRQVIYDVAVRIGASAEIVANDLGTYASFLHVPERNAHNRQEIVNALNDVIPTGSDEDIEKAQSFVKMFDDAQAGRISAAELKKNTGYGLAAGFTDTQARLGIQKILNKGYRQEELDRFANTVQQAVKGAMQEALDSGTLSPEQYALYMEAGYEHYVPFYVSKVTDPDADIFLGTNPFNPAEDRRQVGSVSLANHSYVTISQMLQRLGYNMEAKPFRDALAELFETVHPEGLERVNMASPFLSDAAKKADGFFHTVTSTDEDGNLITKRYKYFFTDNRIGKGMKAKIKTTRNPFLRKFAQGTRAFSMMLTVDNLLNSARVIKRNVAAIALHIATKEIRDANGNIIPWYKVQAAILAEGANLMHEARMVMYGNNDGGRDTETMQMFDYLHEQGGISTRFDSRRNRSVEALQRDLKDLNPQDFTGSSIAKLRKIGNAYMQKMQLLAETPSVAAAIALEKLGVPREIIAARILDTFNYTNRGEWHQYLAPFYPFVTASAEGARNLFRDLKTNRGKAVFAANVMAGIAAKVMIEELAEAVCGTDPDTGSIMDSYDIADKSRNIIIPLSCTNILKIPVGYDTNHVAWGLAEGLVGLAKGKYSVGQVLTNTVLSAMQEVSPIELDTDVTSDNLMGGLLLAATPPVLSPLVNVALNANYFGGRIHGDKARGGLASEAAESKTPEIWTSIARDLYKYTGFDTYPENIRFLMQNYFNGPARGLVTAMEQNSLYTTGGQLTARQQLGPIWDAIGLGSYWDNGSQHVDRPYWEYQDKADDAMHKYRVARTSFGTKKGEAAQAAYNRMIAAGSTDDEAALVRAAVQSENERKKLLKNLHAKNRAMRQTNLDPAEMKPEYDAFAEQQEQLMRRFIREARENSQ